MSTSRDQEEWIPLQTVDPDLFRRVADGQYEIDPHAVAEAMLLRVARLNEMRRRSRVLVTMDRQRSAFAVKKH